MSAFLHAAIPVEIGGETRTLRFTLRALRELKLYTGKNPLESGGIIEQLEATNDPDLLAVLVWALLYKEDPRPTVEEILDMVSFGDLARIQSAVQMAYSQNAPERSEGSAVDPQTASALPQ